MTHLVVVWANNNRLAGDSNRQLVDNASFASCARHFCEADVNKMSTRPVLLILTEQGSLKSACEGRDDRENGARVGGPDRAMQVHAVIVEDETLTRQSLGTLLRAQGWQVWEASDAAACDAILREESIDLALIDLGLPGRTGQELIADLAGSKTIAILAVTARWQPEQRIAVLEAGADDYVVKPFHNGELIARIRAVLRRRKAQIGNVIKIEGWEVDLDARVARADTHSDAASVQIALTRGEVAILALLAEAGGRIVSRERLSKVAARRAQDGDLRTVDTLIYRLRRKFQAGNDDSGLNISSVPGLGYRLGRTGPASAA
ncbi:response regulator transcription factor [Novosphingobium sp. Chol11]|uniref:response regulator transcription factor n=1 Tax=Novosphingobium sp. Chol11 TaxID=1385763 RepID=UPI0025D2D6DD|nr:response regulator transcription factor [Novosphingobium sp. Chol11]